ncbi:zf-HC2 domain-containing protein [candidate division TA06 bacterium]|nr:zf-HC2 domain-containing protein [candidate division TA06 bacterium]
MSAVKKTEQKHHCRGMGTVFSQYLDKELAQQVCRKLEKHLKDCPDCQTYFDTLKKTVTLYRGLGPQKVPADAQRRLYKVIRLEAGKKGAKK